jgi:cytoskeletal protein RodZ
MKTQSLAFGGVAAIALFCAAPVFAQTAPDQTPPPGTSSQDNGAYGSQVNPPQHSSQAEKQKTQELNSQSVDGTTQSPANLNGEAPATNAPSSTSNEPHPPNKP